MSLLWLKNTFQATLDNHQGQGQMKYSVRLNVDDPKVYELIQVDMDFKTQRSTTKLKKTTLGCEIQIEARDATALRASLNSISQLLKVYEKLK